MLAWELRRVTNCPGYLVLGTFSATPTEPLALPEAEPWPTACPGKPPPQEQGRLPSFFLSLPTSHGSPSWNDTFGGSSPGNTQLTEASRPLLTTPWDRTQVPTRNSCGAEASGLSQAAQTTGPEAGFSLKCMSREHQCPRTTVAWDQRETLSPGCLTLPLKSTVFPSRRAACRVCV